MEKKSIHTVHSHAFLVIPNDGQLQIYQTSKQRKTIVDCLDRPQSTTRLITAVCTPTASTSPATTVLCVEVLLYS